ncbi:MULTISPECIES: ChbG/HpnK family deacetylase [Legionella]|uniref:Cellobiose phosphorylase n=1 Tax=Legionella drozanskii LLAP-1 TaxID=1212489 RepID=A0A0W0SPT8_9GAMM|nr:MULTISPECIES: ChbG/HpnK family deacetylase [Legionella]KTC85414.1 cellobiose phosphorylase [Legionella drozanskii LLAP-1]PJE16209.1 MAG: ChbG/HpnK family deacetylase [Legionella sp.]
MIRELILCADDYAQNETISEGILLLAQKKRINAISCLVNLPDWKNTHHELKQVNKDTYLGLHLNLSLGQALSTKWRKKYSPHFNSHSLTIKQSYLGFLNKECVEAEICAQLDAFSNSTGRLPDFIDGHQHIHQLPIIRDALISIYKQKKLTAFCRNTSSHWRDFLLCANFPKAQAISLLGGFSFKKLLRQQLISANSSFAGIYNFARAKNYRYYFKKFLYQSDNGGLIMCHPGLHSNDHRDALHPYRHYELNYLMSSEFLSDLDDAQCRLQLKPSFSS